MAEETQKPAAPEEVVVVEETQKPAAPEEVVAVAETEPAEAPEPETETVAEKEAVEEIAQSASFKEETNLVGELPDPQKKALDELKALIQEALNKHDFTTPPPPPAPAKEEEKKVEEEEKKVEEEEKKVDEEEKKVEEVAASPSVEVKAEEKVAEEVKAEEEAPTETVVVEEEVIAVVDEDGVKTVEAIEETIVAVSTEEAIPEVAKEAGETPEVEAEAPPPPEADPIVPEEVFIFGIPLLGDDRSDTILLKFLRARDFKVKDAFTMIKNTVKWRKEFGIEALLEEDLGTELEKAVFMHGFDKEGHPVCYNVYGAFQDKELYQNCFSDEEKRVKFLRWRIQFLEKSIRKLDFSPTGVCTIVQVNDFKNSPGPAKRELRQATNQALTLFQDNYPEFVAKQVFINVPWWHLAIHIMVSPFLTQRTKSKFVFAGPSKSAETLFKYIAPEQVPVQYGGHSREGEQEFTVSDSVTEITIKPSSKHTVEFPISETSVFVWELRVVGWDVSYGAEFVPSHEEGYTVIVSKARKVSPTEEPIITDSYKIGEPGKIVLTLDNQSSKKKKLLYRTKAKPLVE